METKITVGKYLSEEKDQILDIIAQTIDNKDKIHVKAPVGSGKTTLILELIQRYPNKRFIILFPQISITEQVKTKLTNLNIEACIINSGTVRKAIVKNTDDQVVAEDRVFLTTIDSAYKLIDAIEFEADKTVVVVDETHTFLTSARKNHTRSVNTILKAGYPVIGFSATPSSWVNRMLFGVENFISVVTTDVTPAIVDRTKIEQSALRTLAYAIATENKPLSIVFTERKNTHRDLRALIKEYDLNISVCILNAITNTSTEKAAWNYLMKNDALPTGTNVFILNSVVQSGINILNQDIDSVYLFGTFDPFGFAQYLGRCRHYNKPFQYYYDPYSKEMGLEHGGKEIQERIEWMVKLLDAEHDAFAAGIKSLMAHMIYKDADQDNVVNKCMVASWFFDKLRDLGGETLISVVNQLFKHIEFTDENAIEGEVQTSAKSKAKSRAIGKSKVVDFIRKEYALIIKVFDGLEYNCSETDLVDAINTKYTGKQQHKKLTDMVELMRKAQVTPHKISTAAYFYKNSGNNTEVLDKYLAISHNTAIAISKAAEFFRTFPRTNATIKKALRKLEGQVNKSMSIQEWKEAVDDLLPEVKLLWGNTDNFFRFCLQLKGRDKRKLVGINTCFQDYIQWLNLDDFTVVNGKIALK